MFHIVKTLAQHVIKTITHGTNKPMAKSNKAIEQTDIELSGIPPWKETSSNACLPLVEVKDSSELTPFRNIAGAQPSSP